MRVALIADIHGNRVALEVVLSHIERQHVDQVVCLGDVAALGPEPARCVERVRDVATITVMGNTDAWLLPTQSDSAAGESAEPNLQEMTAWGRARLAEVHLAEIAGYPPSATVPLGPALSMLVFHGSPRSFNDVISATTPIMDLESLLSDQTSGIFAGGHTHLPLLRRIDGALVINPGSVGLPGVGPGTPDLPVNTDVHWAEYAIVESDDGSTSVTFHRVPLSVRQMIHSARSSGMPGLDWWTSLWRRRK